jgi:16S rRNA (cytosine1402-N4)-methyltransferase
MVGASDEECAVNPRARSAKLRAGMRTEAPAGTDDLSIFNLPSLAGLEKMGS